MTAHLLKCLQCATNSALRPKSVSQLQSSPSNHSSQTIDSTLCPQKTCDYIFYNNFNNNCPITIIFGIVTSNSIRHRQVVSFSTSLVQLPYLGKSQNTKNNQFCSKQHIVLWINNVLRHVWLLEASAETARHCSNTGRSPSPRGWQISVQSYPLVTR